MPAPPESHRRARGSSPNPLEVSTTTANARPAAPCQNDGSATPSQVAVWALVQFVATQFQLMQSNSKKYNLPERLGAELSFRIVLGLEHADAPHPLPLLRHRRERPSRRPAAECGQQFPPSDGDCHTPLPCEVRKKGTIPRHERAVLAVQGGQDAGCLLLEYRRSKSLSAGR